MAVLLTVLPPKLCGLTGRHGYRLARGLLLEDLGDIDFLISLAMKLEMDVESLRQALAHQEFLPTVIQDEQEAQLSGISGVPAFIAGRRFAMTGVHPIEDLIKLVSHVRSRTSG